MNIEHKKMEGSDAMREGPVMAIRGFLARRQAEVASGRRWSGGLLWLALAMAGPALAATPVGFVQGTVGVSADGRAQQSVALVAPVGINGFVPRLSLNYSSAMGDGPLGPGWYVGGLSQITRCPATLAQDGRVGNVSFTTADRFCLDGNRILVGSSSVTDAQYHAFSQASGVNTEIEQGLSLTRMTGTAAYTDGFVVRDRAGVTRYYGNPNGTLARTDACLFPSGNPTGSTCGAYALAREVDRNGATINYFYSSGSEEAVIDRIEYAVAGGSRAVIRFIYEGRLDSTSYYMGGQKLSRTLLLSSVEMRYGTLGAEQLLRKYALSYVTEKDTARKLVKTLTECDAQNNCLPPVTMKWSGEVANNYQIAYKKACSSDTSDSACAGSFKDTLPDEFKISANRSTSDLPVRYGDLNGDGLVDIVYAGNGEFGDPIERAVYLNKGGYFEKSPEYTANITQIGFWVAQVKRFRRPPYNSDINPNNIYARGGDVLDVNGDGFADLIFAYSNVPGESPSSRSEVYLNNPNNKTFEYNAAYSQSPNAINQSIATRMGSLIVGVYPSGLRYADINGDGLVDAFYSQREFVSTTDSIPTNEVYLNTGSSFTLDTSYSGSMASISQLFAAQWSSTATADYDGWIDSGFIPMDVNGDGAADIVQLFYRDNPVIERTKVYLNNPAAKTFTENAEFSAGLTGIYAVKYVTGDYTDISRGVRFEDLNGDGLPDLIYQAGGSSALPQVKLNTGTTFIADTTYSSGLAGLMMRFPYRTPLDFYDRYTMSTVYQSKNDAGLYFNDINGDGLPDVVQTYYELTDKLSLNTWSENNITPIKKVLINNGKTFVVPANDVQTKEQFALTPTNCTPSDVGSGVGMASVCSNTWVYYYSAPTFMLDINADGLVDYYSASGMKNVPGSSPSRITDDGLAVQASGRSQLVTEVDNAGSTTTLKYAASPAFRATDVPQDSCGSAVFRSFASCYSQSAKWFTDGYTLTNAQRLKSASWVVSELLQETGRSPAGSDYNQRTRYEYYDLMVDRLRRASLGFRRTFTAADALEGGVVATGNKAATEETVRLQAFPYTGMRSSSTRKVNGVLSETYTSSVNNVRRGGQSWLPFPSSESTTAYDPLQASNPMVSGVQVISNYDQYGNLISRLKSHGDLRDGLAVFDIDNESFNYYAPVTGSAQWDVGLLKLKTVSSWRDKDYVISGTKVRRSGYAYDTGGRLQQEFVEPIVNAAGTPEPGTSDSSYTLTYTRDPAAGGFALVTATDISGGTVKTSRSYALDSVVQGHTRYEYDATKRFVVKTWQATDVAQGTASPELVSEELSQDALYGLPGIRKDSDGRTTVLGYDDWGRKTSESHPNHTQLGWSYEWCVASENCSYKLTSTQVGAPSQVERFDQWGRKLATQKQLVNGDWSTVSQQFDVYGRAIKVSEPAIGTAQYFTQTEYDLLDRPKMVTRPNASTLTLQYAGLVTKQFESDMPNAGIAGHGCGNTVLDPGESRREVRDAKGRVYKVTDACGKEAQYDYDVHGNLLSIVDTLNNKRSWTYDNYGRKLREITIDTGSEQTSEIAEFTYDPLGHLILGLTNAQRLDTDKPGTRYFYDDVGRLTDRFEEDLDSKWFYSTTPGTIGLVEKVTAGNLFERTYEYDAATAQLLKTVTKMDGKTFAIGQSYDVNNGRVETISYEPTGLSLENSYDPDSGYLIEVKHAGSGRSYWKLGQGALANPLANALDARGNVVRATLGSGVVMARQYYSDTGRLNTQTAGLNNDTALQNESYSFDPLGNLSSRSDYNLHLVETFSYDALNRLGAATLLNQSSLVGPAPQVAHYNAIGNITFKTGVGDYVYDPARPHAVRTTCADANTASSCQPDFGYDNNGNLLSGNGRVYEWANFNRPTIVTSGTGSASRTQRFWYDVDHQRAKSEQPDGSMLYYINPRLDSGATFEVNEHDGIREFTHHVYAGGQPVGSLVTVSNSGAETPVLDQPFTVADGTTQVSGLDIPASPLFAIQGGHLVVKTLQGTAVASPVVSSTLPVAVGKGVVLKAKVNLLGNAGTNGRFVVVGMDNGLSTLDAKYRRVAAYFRGRNVYASYAQGTDVAAGTGASNLRNTLLGAVSDNGVYRVEVEALASGATLWVYPDGQTRTQGMRYALQYNNMDSARLIVHGYQGPDEVANSVYVDDLQVVEGAIAVTASAPLERYFHSDHLGSIVAISDDAGHLLERLSYDPWGKRRHIDGSEDMQYADQWTQDFANGSDGLVLPASSPLIALAPVCYSNKLVVKSPLLASSTEALVLPTRTYALDQNFRVKAQVQTTTEVAGNNGESGRYFEMGLDNGTDKAASGHLGVSLRLIGKRFHAYVDETPAGEWPIDVADNTVYSVELSHGQGRMLLHVYQWASPEKSWVYELARPQGWASAVRWYVAGQGGPNESSTASNAVNLLSVKEQLKTGAQSLASWSTHHGYTQHEMMDGIGLVNMNARLYDPVLGRFTGTDPVLAYPFNPQDLNRYGYVWNNPLSFTDPSGELVPLAIWGGLAVWGAWQASGDIVTAYENPTSGNILKATVSTELALAGMAPLRALAGAGNALVRAEPVVAPVAAKGAIGFAPGEAASALTANRLQHATDHLVKAGIFPRWRGSSSPQLIREALIPILENPTATFHNTLGTTAVRGFIGEINGRQVAVQIFSEGPYKGQIATSVVPTLNQLVKWGVSP